MPALFIGYLFAIPTLGLTLLAIWYENYRRAEIEVKQHIEKLNASNGYLKLSDRGIELKLVK